MLGGLLAAGLVLAACGGSSHPTSAAPTTTSTTVAGGRGGALVAFRSCMSSHGVTLATRPRGASGAPSTTPGETRPPGGGGGGFGGGNFANRYNTPPAGVDPTKYKAALAACRSKLPTGTGNALNSSAFQAYRSCLKDHGVTLPATGGAGSINRSDPKVQAAMKTCQPLLPAGGFGRSTSTTTAPGA
jgi:hypothetical protein